MTEKELRTWMRRESLSDAWHISIDDKPSAKAATLAELYAQFHKSAEPSLYIMHESQLKKANPAWVEFELNSFDPEASRSGRKRSSSGRSSRRSSNRSRGILLQVFLLLIVCAIGAGIWVAVTSMKQEKSNRALTEEEEISFMLESLERNLSRNADTRDEQQGDTPVIRTVISATQHMLMVKNSNLENWPSFVLTIILPNGERFACSFTDPIPAYSTLSISMRRIVDKDGKALSRDMIISGTQLELEVPGYPKWSSAL